MFLIFDTETTGLPARYNAPLTDSENWPRMVQLAWQLLDQNGNRIEAEEFIIKPEGYTIPYNAEKVHRISTEKALSEGKDLRIILEQFLKSVEKARFLVGHNVEFDVSIVGAELIRKQINSGFTRVPVIDTKVESTDFCALPGGKNGRYKWPTLSELYRKLFKSDFEEAHNASADVAATARCFLELLRKGIIPASKFGINDVFFEDIIENDKNSIQTDPFEKNGQEEANTIIDIVSQEIEEEEPSKIESKKSDKPVFTHLHVHTQYSILDGAADITRLIQKAKGDGMLALAITDHGNMFGVKEFHSLAKKNGIKPIIGCEVYVASRSRFDKSEKSDGGGRHLILLAKNMTGYHNLVKLVSYGWIEGFYYKPRIDKELLGKYSEGLIACSACLNGVISHSIRNESLEKAQEILQEYRKIFGSNFYLELQRHPTDDPDADKEVYKDQIFVNKALIQLGQETQTPLVATNDVHFINQEDAEAHDRLLCISTGKDLDDPNRMRYTRQEWLKTQDEMWKLFADQPEALKNTSIIADQIEEYELNSAPIMPEFPIPEDFGTLKEYRQKHSEEKLVNEFSQSLFDRLGGYEKAIRVQLESDYLRYLVYQGAETRYGKDLDESLKERIEFELNTVKTLGYPGYFLIVWDFIKAAREMGVSVGPGRGSAAGSVVAYSLRITDVDPIRYNLLFERFMNPDRISLPDIDIDFDEDGRDKVLKYVAEKYGARKVAHIITFGTMAPKMAIRDVARVQKLELSEADRLAKLIPDRPGTSFEKAYEEVPGLLKEKESNNILVAQTMKYAEVLEGSVRQTGVHACGIIIGRENLEEHIPICTSKDAELFVTQFDGKHIESVGMLKMDFLGLKTLSIIQDTIINIKQSKGTDIDIDTLPLDDAKTFEIYSKGETTGLFQFESAGMKKYLRALKPNRFEDLIAMNALYRPGPLEYIPQFIARKHGREKINYDLPEMEEILKDTYGITVYQEQVMLLSQKLAGFTKGLADLLRKAMGKKIKAVMDDLQEKFLEGCLKNGFPERVVKKIWSDWESFAQYAFNKSHSTCYALVSYQTAYLKAHFPAEFMAAVLSRNLNDIKKITFFMEECRRMGLRVLVPDINESFARFTVNKDGNIRFGLAAIKGLGESAVWHIIEERQKNGIFKDIYDFVERVNVSIINKRSIEVLVMAGGLDSFNDIQRYQYFIPDKSNLNLVDHLVRYGNLVKTQQLNTLFDQDLQYQNAQKKPEIFAGNEWPPLVKLNKEKELIGIYLSSHPLDDYKLEIRSFTNCSLSDLNDLENYQGKEIAVAGFVTEVSNLTTKTGKPFGIMIVEDYSDSHKFMIFGKEYEDFRKYMYVGYSLLIKGTIQLNPFRKDPGTKEIKIKSIVQLNNVKEKLVNNLAIKISLSDLSEEIINELLEHTNKNKGNTRIKFCIFDKEAGINLDMFSRNTAITLTDEFIDFLQGRPEMEFRIN